MADLDPTDPTVGAALFGPFEEWANDTMSAVTDNAEANGVPPEVFVLMLAVMMGGLLGSMVEPKSRVKTRDVANRLVAASMRAGVKRNPAHN